MTDSSASTLSADLDQAVVDEINIVRTNPAAYIPVLEAWLRRFVSYTTVQLPSGDRIETQEGQAVAKEILWFLQAAHPRKPLVLSKKMSEVARGFLDSSESGDNSATAEVAVNLSRKTNSPQEAVLQFLIDDGCIGRDRRRNILNPDFKVAGVAEDFQGQGGCAIAFASEENSIAVPAIQSPFASALDSESVVAPTNSELKTVASSLLAEVNQVRANPKSYIPILTAWRQRFVDEATLVLPSGRQKLTTEGITAVDGALNILNLITPVQPLVLSPGMCQSVRDRLTKLATTEEREHPGSDRLSVGDFLERYGIWAGRWGENRSYGRKTAQEIVAEWLIDDGVASRSHRNKLLDPEFRKAGVSCTHHHYYESICAVVFANQYDEKNDG